MMPLFVEFDPSDGLRMTKARVKELEAKLLDSPDDISARSSLVVHYQLKSKLPNAKELYASHLLYLIQHAPTCDVLATGHGLVSRRHESDLFVNANRLWEEHLAGKPADPRVLRNAANFYFLNDPDTCKRLLLTGMEVDPDSAFWPHQIARLYSLRLQQFPDRAQRAATGLGYLERAMSLAPTGLERFSMMDNAAVLAFEAGDFEKARRYANELIENADNSEVSWDAGNAIHKGNIVLGRIALRNGRVSDAVQHLLNAGRIQDTPHLGSFGPNMSLAKELIDAGERDGVIEYFELCRHFWKFGAKELDEWTANVKAGATPDFGPNLVY